MKEINMLAKNRVLQSIMHNMIANTIEVRWLNQIEDGGIVLSSIPEIGTYTPETKSALTSDLGELANSFIANAGW